MLLHNPFISAIADNATAFYRGRAELHKIRQNKDMNDSSWRQRLEAAVLKDDRSLRDISLAAGLSHGYLHGILRDEKEPTLDRFTKICQELGVSLSYALMGIEITPEVEQIISRIEGDAAAANALVTILKARAK